MALLQRQTLTDIKKSHIKRFKVALLDFTRVSENCCNVDEDGAFALTLFSYEDVSTFNLNEMT